MPRGTPTNRADLQALVLRREALDLQERLLEELEKTAKAGQDVRLWLRHLAKDCLADPDIKDIENLAERVWLLDHADQAVTLKQIDDQLSAEGKKVVIIGGGDTGSDCLGTAHRHGAAAVYQFELMPQPPDERTPDMPWPYWPMVLRTSSSQEER